MVRLKKKKGVTTRQLIKDIRKSEKAQGNNIPPYPFSHMLTFRNKQVVRFQREIEDLIEMIWVTEHSEHIPHKARMLKFQMKYLRLFLPSRRKEGYWGKKIMGLKRNAV